MVPPNGLGFSRAAPIDRNACGTNLSVKIGAILLDAQRRRLQRHVGRQLGISFGKVQKTARQYRRFFAV